MSIQIPSFAFGVWPTRQMLNDCRTIGLISPSVSTYESKAEFESLGSGALPPVNGKPKYWANPNANVAKATCMLTGDVHPAGNLTTFEALMYSASARNFYSERPTLSVPKFELVELDQTEWRRLSFAEGVEDPEEFPIGEVFSFDMTNPEDNFPKNIVLVMIDGGPCALTIDEAIRTFPLTNQMPTGPGASQSWSDAQLIHVADTLMSGVTKRMQYAALKTSGKSESEIAKGLVSL